MANSDTPGGSVLDIAWASELVGAIDELTKMAADAGFAMDAVMAAVVRERRGTLSAWLEARDTGAIHEYAFLFEETGRPMLRAAQEYADTGSTEAFRALFVDSVWARDMTAAGYDAADMWCSVVEPAELDAADRDACRQGVLGKLLHLHRQAAHLCAVPAEAGDLINATMADLQRGPPPASREEFVQRMLASVVGHIGLPEREATLLKQAVRVQLDGLDEKGRPRK